MSARSPSPDNHDMETSEGAEDVDLGGCGRFFGVRSHLHQLYDYKDAPAGSLLLPMDTHMTWRNRWRTRRRCMAFLWLALMWLGAFSLFGGLALMLAGYAVPRQPAVVGYASISAVTEAPGSSSPRADQATAAEQVSPAMTASGSTAGFGDLLLVDRSALDLNAALDACKVAGLVTLCCGGFVLILALAVPLTKPFAAEQSCPRCRLCCYSQADDVKINDRLLCRPVPACPPQKVIPAAHFLSNVQPQLKPD